MSCSRPQHTRTAPVLARALRLPTRLRRPVVRAGSNHEQSHRSTPAQTTRHTATAARQSPLTYGSPPHIRAAVTTAGERSTNDTRHRACGKAYTQPCFDQVSRPLVHRSLISRFRSLLLPILVSSKRKWPLTVNIGPSLFRLAASEREPGVRDAVWGRNLFPAGHLRPGRFA
jgi:hypothetical protein